MTLDSCHSQWIFDPERRRFRRVPKGLGFGERQVMTEWRPYAQLHLDPGSGAFRVVLDEAGTRMLQSWRHTEGMCANCGMKTEELAAEDIAPVDAS
ncbi:MAG TPA: hypothetical protein VEI83_02570 [Acidimicrobiales bacterium]|nr:hypothetical protein [Acidimicrobiales bacterium]